MSLEGLTKDETVRLYKNWAHSLAYAWGGYDCSEHDDLAQEALIGVWKALNSYDSSKGALPSYAAKGGKLQLLDCIRRHKWTGSPSLRGSSIRTEPAVPLADDDPLWSRETVADFSEQSVLVSTLRQIILTLEPAHRKYLYLRFWLDIPVAEIENYLEVSGRHAWKLIREKIKNELSNTHEEEVHQRAASLCRS